MQENMAYPGSDLVKTPNLGKQNWGDLRKPCNFVLSKNGKNGQNKGFKSLRICTEGVKWVKYENKLHGSGHG